MFLLFYSDAATFFGYSVLFTAALPASPTFAFINKLIGLKLDAYQVTEQYRRPPLLGGQDIGTWQTVFELIATIGVITNAGLICFTMNVLTKNPYWSFSMYGKAWIFIGFQWVLFVSQLVVRLAVRDIPHHVEIQSGRNKFIISKVIDGVKDEDNEKVLKSAAVSHVINIGDINGMAPGM